MKHLKLVLICLISIVSLCGCTNTINKLSIAKEIFNELSTEANQSRPIEKKDYSTIDELFQFTFPSDWVEQVEKYETTEGELRMASSNEDFYFLALTYRQMDLAIDMTPEKVFQLQIEDMKSKRKNWKELESTNVEIIDEKKITTALYSGEKDFSKMYYKFSLIQFDNNQDNYVIAIQIALPSRWDNGKQVFDEILASAKSLD